MPIFFQKMNRFEYIRLTNRIESIRIANWNAVVSMLKSVYISLLIIRPVCMPMLGLCWHCVGKLHYGLPAPGQQLPSTVVARCWILAVTPALGQNEDE